jgi:hypothetical protein
MRRRTMLWALAVLLGLAASGCSLKLGESTSGELGRVNFAYATDCLFGCGMNRSLIVGSQAIISVTSVANDSGVTAVSGTPGVASFKVERSCWCDQTSNDSSSTYSIDKDQSCPSGWTKDCENTIEVTALSTGDTELELDDATGQLIDRTPVHVRAPKTVGFEQDFRAAMAFRVEVNQSTTILAHFTDADGRDMIATNGVTWSLGEPTVAELSSGAVFSPAVPSPVELGGEIELTGARAGKTQLELQVGSLTRKIPVTIAK